MAYYQASALNAIFHLRQNDLLIRVSALKIFHLLSEINADLNFAPPFVKIFKREIHIEIFFVSVNPDKNIFII
jgi:hypothetical protein